MHSMLSRGRVNLIVSFMLVAAMVAVSAGTIVSGDTGLGPEPCAFAPPWEDDFEFGTLGGSTTLNWSTTSALISGVSTATSESGTHSMFTCGGLVTVNSSVVDTSGLTVTMFKFWLQRGSDAFSEDTDAGDDLEVYYLNDLSGWVLLETFLGSGTKGEVMWRNYTLPGDANHANFQVRFRQVSGSGSGFDYWHMDDVYIGPPPPYALELNPDLSKAAGNAGEDSDHVLTLDNIGANNDCYNLSAQTNWTIVFRDLADTMDITNVSVATGGTAQFIARVSIPGGAISGDFDLAQVNATSQNGTGVAKSVDLFTAPVFSNPWLDDFETGMFGGSTGFNWSSSVASTANYGITGATSDSGAYSMYTSGGPVTLESWIVDVSNLSSPILNFWLQRGGADVGENLLVDYLNSTGIWKTLDTFLGDGTSVQQMQMFYSLPADGIHDSLQVRFTQTGGTTGIDNWYIDDVYIGPAPPYSVDMEPENNATTSPAGASVDYIVNITNHGANNDTYDLSYNSTWTVTFIDIIGGFARNNISVTTGSTQGIIARITVPAGAALGDFCVSSLTATSQNSANVTDEVQVTTTVSLGAPWLDDFEWGLFGGSTGANWTSSNGLLSGVSGDFTYSGNYSMYVYQGPVNVDSTTVDVTSLAAVEVQYWVIQGSNDVNNEPEAGENLQVYYFNNVGSWILIETFLGSDPGATYYQRSHLLPGDAVHEDFQIRFRHTGGSAGSDYWHIDDVYIGAPAPQVVNTTPVNRALDVLENQNISVVFDETMDTGITPVLTQINGTDPGGWNFVGWSTTNVTDDTATWSHNDWVFNISVTMEVTGGTNLNGTVQPAPCHWNFTILNPDLVDPIVDAGPDVIENSRFTQYGTAADAGSGVFIIQWSKASGPGNVTFGTPNLATTTVQADVDGVYIIRLVVIDNEGNMANDTFTLTWDTVVPVVDAGDDVTINHQFTKNATISDEGSGISQITWFQTSGPGMVLFGSEYLNHTTISATTDGTYVVQVSVSDFAGNTGMDQFTLVWDASPPDVEMYPRGTDVSVDSNIRFVFNEPVSRDSVQTGMTVSRRDGSVYEPDTSVTGTFEWNSANTTVTYVLDNDLLYSSQYRVTLNNVEDMLGNVLGSDYQSFTTEAEPEPPNGDVSGSVVDSSGNPIEGAIATIIVNGTSYSDTTDSSGEFTIQGVPVGTHELIVSNGNSETTLQVTVVDGQVTNLDPITLGGNSNWVWLLLILIILIVGGIFLYLMLKNNNRQQLPPQPYQGQYPPPPGAAPPVQQQGNYPPPPVIPPQTPPEGGYPPPQEPPASEGVSPQLVENE